MLSPGPGLQRPRGVIRFARAVVQRPGLAGKHEERQQAFGLLARQAADAAESLAYLEKGRQASAAAGRSCASGTSWS